MSSIVVSGDTSGSITFQAPSVAGSTTLTLPATSGTVLTTASTDTASSLNAGVGAGQTWQNVTRAIGTTYTNTTGKTIVVAISYTNSAGNSVQGLIINGSITVYAAGILVAASPSGFCIPVPAGATYATLTNGGTMTLVTWAELR